MKVFFVSIVILHGLIHLTGLRKAREFSPGKSQQSSKKIFTVLLWLTATFLFLLISILYLISFTYWWIVAGIAVILSQYLIVQNWKEARYGTTVNLFVVLVAVISWNEQKIISNIKTDLNEIFPDKAVTDNIIDEKLIQDLPPVVKKWLINSNITGKPQAHNLYLTQSGSMRSAMNGKWMSVKAEQWFNPVNPGFIWHAHVQVIPGIYLSGVDISKAGKGNMQIKFLSLYPLVDTRGDETDQGTLSRFLAEIMWFPSGAISPYIQWQQTDSCTAMAHIKYCGTKADGIFRFSKNGRIKSFETKRYYYRKEGPTLENWYIDIDPEGYTEFEGIRVPARCTVTWKLKEGDFEWFKVNITNIRYNI